MSFQRQPKDVTPFVAARKIDEKISFTRNNHEVQGTIFKILEQSVIVEISTEDAKKINVPSNLTVVSHKHYTVL